MNPLVKASIGGIVRAVSVYLGAKGVEISTDEINALVDALLILVPIVWSIAHKVNVHRKISDAKAGL